MSVFLEDNRDITERTGAGGRDPAQGDPVAKAKCRVKSEECRVGRWESNDPLRCRRDLTPGVQPDALAPDPNMVGATRRGAHPGRPGGKKAGPPS